MSILYMIRLKEVTILHHDHVPITNIETVISNIIRFMKDLFRSYFVRHHVINGVFKGSIVEYYISSMTHKTFPFKANNSSRESSIYLYIYSCGMVVTC